ncbi:MAG: EFR1 family ferrodoxin [Solobacterium sp.]|nr:EFR1 family ferrodoxin [Solobacterium sp.]
MLFYFTSTGNSLYAAKQFDEELYSIPQELNKENRHYKAERIGIVCPLYEFDLPVIVKDFILHSEFETDYFYIVMTYGMHHGGCASRNAEYFEKAGRHIDYFNTINMLDNALPVFDMDEQRKIDPEKKVDEHLAMIKTDIAERKQFIQPATKEEVDFYGHFIAIAADFSAALKQPKYSVSDKCIGCGICTRVCPKGCICVTEGRATYDSTNCFGCMACIHACPQKAIGYVEIKERNPEARYRNPNIQLMEIIKSNNQN